jgi:hypothetical protein
MYGMGLVNKRTKKPKERKSEGSLPLSLAFSPFLSLVVPELVEGTVLKVFRLCDN